MKPWGIIKRCKAKAQRKGCFALGFVGTLGNY